MLNVTSNLCLSIKDTTSTWSSMNYNQQSADPRELAQNEQLRPQARGQVATYLQGCANH